MRKATTAEQGIEALRKHLDTLLRAVADENAQMMERDKNREEFGSAEYHRGRRDAYLYAADTLLQRAAGFVTFWDVLDGHQPKTNSMPIPPCPHTDEEVEASTEGDRG